MRATSRSFAIISPAAGASWRRFVHLAFEAVLDPAFGLSLGARVRPELFGVVGFTAMTSATYGDALGQIARYKSVLSADRMEREALGDVVAVRLYLDGAEDPYARQRVDAEMAFLLSLGRLFTGRAVQPERLAVPFPRPAYHPRYAQLFAFR